MSKIKKALDDDMLAQEKFDKMKEELLNNQKGEKMNFDYYVNYFSMLEDRLVDTGRYVAFENENLSTFSVEYASIINECCALINGFCYDLCKIRRPDRKEFDVNEYKKEFMKNKFEVKEYISFGKFVLQPWSRLLTNKIDARESTPSWWNKYNDVKHGGEVNFRFSTLQNAISCMAGMFWLLFIYDINQQGLTMCSWRGAFRDAGNCERKVSWEC